jgi:LysM repeat protein
MPSRKPPSAPQPSSSGGPERLILAAALLLPLGVILLALGQLPGTSFASPSAILHTDASMGMLSKRPVVTSSEPPPTLVPPTATPRPTATPMAAMTAPQATATAGPKKGSYTVQPGDELKQIAAQYNISIWKIIAANEIPNPDSLRVGQVLRIPE